MNGNIFISYARADDEPFVKQLYKNRTLFLISSGADYPCNIVAKETFQKSDNII